MFALIKKKKGGWKEGRWNCKIQNIRSDTMIEIAKQKGRKTVQTKKEVAGGVKMATFKRAKTYQEGSL